MSKKEIGSVGRKEKERVRKGVMAETMRMSGCKIHLSDWRPDTTLSILRRMRTLYESIY